MQDFGTDGEPTARPGEDRADRVEAMAQALATQFGDRAPAIIQRQALVATEPSRGSWRAILIRVNALLAARGRGQV